MYKITCEGKEFFALDTENLLQSLRRNGIAILADCNGQRVCKKCKVRIEPQFDCFSKVYLTKEEYESGIRLACFVTPQSDMRVEVIGSFDAEILTIDRGVFNGSSTVQDSEKLFGACDIGTTTVTITIFNEKFEHIKTMSFLNPQKPYGADVISRIKASDEGNLTTMSDAILDKISTVIREFRLEKFVISANNIMLHILLNVSPSSIGVLPYKPQFTDLKRLRIKELLQVDYDGELVIMPSISGFVGADIVAGILATELEREENALFIDLGTNGEMVLSGGGKLYATSTAAGPCFEGGNISKGTFAQEKAISKVKFENGKIVPDVKDAVGICGSGLIDVLAVLVENDIIDEMGGFNNCDIVKEQDGEKRVYLTENVYISQKDVRMVQLAKSAISCGIISLLERANIEVESLSKVIIAGGFSKGLNFKSCERIGLLLEGMSEKCEAVGNTSIKGSVLAIKNDLFNKASGLSQSVEVVELGSDANFMENYTERMIF